MTTIGTPFTKNSTKIMLLGAGELGKEIAIEAQRLGIEVIAVDRYDHAPAMQVAQRSFTINMLDTNQLEQLILTEKPDYIFPEIEAISTDTLKKLETQIRVIPNAQAVWQTMDRMRIRKLAHETLQLPTTRYRFVDSFDEFNNAVIEIGLPCVVKPVMSSSGKGQSIVKHKDQIESAWHYAHEHGRATKVEIIIEEFLPFDYEITLLTVRHINGTSFCEPIGHHQVDGDYRESWQPQLMSTELLEKAKHIAKTITDALGGFGLFGVELFIKDDKVYFNEVSPRPHDTGMVTLISQNISEFALHLRAALGLPIPTIKLLQPSASAALVVEGKGSQISYSNLEKALAYDDAQLRLFAKPEINGSRRLGVALASRNSIDEARNTAIKMIENIIVKVY